MTAHLSRRETHPRSTARTAAWRLRRLAVALTAATCGLLASALIIPAASARTTMFHIPTRAGQAEPSPPPRSPATPAWSPAAAWRAGRSP